MNFRLIGQNGLVDFLELIKKTIQLFNFSYEYKYLVFSGGFH